MKKKNGWKWTLALTIWCGIGAFSILTSTNYDRFVQWPLPTAATVVFAALTVWLRTKGKREAAAAAREKADREAAAAREKADREAAARKSREEYEERLRKDRERFDRIRFPVAGVTFKNDDGMDRQKILREIALNEDGFVEVWFEEDEELGDESGIRVLTDYGCVGYVRRSDKTAIRRFFDRMTNSRILRVERFENDDGEKIYRADVCITMDREDPEQQWYFDDLHES